ncbi:MAG: hemolysin XhlA family protein [Janthinobacterium sp.]|jgi:hypothetical protein
MEIRERLVRVETKLDTNNDLRGKVEAVECKATETESRSKSNTHRIDKLEEAHTWLWRTVAGAFIIAAIGVFIALVKTL